MARIGAWGEFAGVWLWVGSARLGRLGRVAGVWVGSASIILIVGEVKLF